jgi:hypothetical protein
VKQDIFVIPGGVLGAGSHAFSFKFDLPDNIPSSVFFKDDHVREKPRSKIKYNVQAKLEGSIARSKQVLIIREKPVTFKSGVE